MQTFWGPVESDRPDPDWHALASGTEVLTAGGCCSAEPPASPGHVWLREQGEKLKLLTRTCCPALPVPLLDQVLTLSEEVLHLVLEGLQVVLVCDFANLFHL